jgi:hypothetical protein
MTGRYVAGPHESRKFAVIADAKARRHDQPAYAYVG